MPTDTTEVEPNWRDAWDQWWATVSLPFSQAGLGFPQDQIDNIQSAFHGGWQAASCGRNEAQTVGKGSPMSNDTTRLPGRPAVVMTEEVAALHADSIREVRMRLATVLGVLREVRGEVAGMMRTIDRLEKQQ